MDALHQLRHVQPLVRVSDGIVCAAQRSDHILLEAVRSVYVRQPVAPNNRGTHQRETVGARMTYAITQCDKLALPSSYFVDAIHERLTNECRLRSRHGGDVAND